MKQYIILIACCLLLVAASYNEGGQIKINKHTKGNITALTDSYVMIETTYYSLTIREGQCKSEDIYIFCVESMEENEVEFYPYRYEINISLEALCDSCVPNGGACERHSQCEGECVHEVCRPRSTWCGDGYCDAGESCLVDCPVNETGDATTADVGVTIVDDGAGSADPSGQDASAQEAGDSATTTQGSPEQPLTNPDTEEEPLTPDEERDAEGFIDAPVSAADEPNWVGASLVLLFGIVAIILVFVRHKQKKSDLISIEELEQKAKKDDGDLLT